MKYIAYYRYQGSDYFGVGETPEEALKDLDEEEGYITMFEISREGLVVLETKVSVDWKEVK